jgi:CelD/BcsL family acetyltransferase involved in cellulose biosynthesis
VTVIEIHRAVEPLHREWDELADRSKGTPFLRPGWIGAWWRAFGRGSLEILTLRRNDRLVALVPLYRESSLRSPTNGYMPQFGFLAEDEPAAHAIAEAVFSRGARSVSLELMDESTLAVMDTAAAAARYRRRAWTEMDSPYIDVEGDWADYEHRLGRELRHVLRRRWRRLREEGDAAVEIVEGGDGLQAFLEEGFAVEASGWKGAAGTAVTSQPEVHRFMTEIADWAAERGTLRLAFLRLAGHPLAFEFSLEEDGILYTLKTGYDPAFRKFGPGTLVLHSIIERAFSAGLRRVELLGADSPDKRVWATGYRRLSRLRAFRPSPGGAFAFAASVYGRPAAKRALRLFR